MKLLKELFEEVMNELLVHGNRKGARYVIAFREHVWLFPETHIDFDTAVGILDATGVDQSKIYGGIPEDFYDFQSAMEDDKNVMLVFAEIQGRTLSYNAQGSFVHDPQSSVTLKKIVQALGLASVEKSSMSGEYSTRTSKKKMTGEIASVVYHGTSSAYLEQILRVGLRPGEANSNYENVLQHDPEYFDKIEGQVFFTSRFDEAQDHGVHTVTKLSQGVPVVLQMRVPNKNLVQTDYDIGDLFPDDAKKGSSLSRETGIYGYKGSILPAFIDYVHVPKPEFVMDKEKIYYMTDKDFKKLNKQRALSYIEKVENYY